MFETTDNEAKQAPYLLTATAPTSCAQERLWFLDQLGLVGSTYNMPLALRLEGALDVQALERSVTKLIERHESLRTRFNVERGVPHQVIDSDSRLELQSFDISEAGDVERHTLLGEYIRREQLDRFDLVKGPLLRAVLVKLQTTEHVLLLTMHHIISDGWSLGILRRELQTLYAAITCGQLAPLGLLSSRYVEYARLQRKLQPEILRTQLPYWKETLRDSPPQLQLPTDRLRPAVESFKGGDVRIDLPPRLCNALRELARREGVTLFMLSLAVYQLLLFRLSGQQDIVVGAPVAGRNDASVHDVVGCFVNTLAFRTRLSGNPTFRELLERVRDVSLDAYAHQDVPFEVLVKELCPERNLAQQQIFQVMLAVQSHPEERSQLPGLSWTWIDVERVNAHFDLTLYVYEAASELSCRFEYATDLFDRSTIERMATHLQMLFEGVVTNPDAHIENIPLLTAVERWQVLHAFNDTIADYPRDRLVHELFEERAAAAPDATAVLYEGESLRYGQLNAMANRLARHLREQGVECSDYVPILMTRSLQMLVAQIAVLKCGAAYVPMDPALPAERLVFLIHDCGARHIVANQNPDTVAFDGSNTHWIDCSGIADHLEAYPVDNLNARINRPHPAYVMYTSGSTGTPKGVVVPHHAINRLVLNTNYVRIEPSDRFAHASNPSFDASTFEIWGALLNGACVVIVPPSVVLDGLRFATALSESGVTVAWLTIGLLTQYSAVLARALSKLRYVLTGGDVVDPTVTSRIMHDAQLQHLINAYGPTECTTFSTAYPIEITGERINGISIGRPITNTRIYILDDYLQPVPIGVIGEIYIGGPGVAIGYLNRAELTALRFIADPFGPERGAHMYRSGDLAKWQADGMVDFLGRHDRQVKIRGFRVELGEIEAELARHPRVSEAAVLARQDGPGGKRLVAYITQRGEYEPTAEDLHSYLASRVPEYMIPTSFVVLDRFPLTPNGKVDRRSLPAPDIDAFVLQRYEAPQGVVEQCLATIWQELLPVPRIGRRDDFFRLGGHSLLVLQAVFNINQSLGCTLTVSDIYRSPILQDLAARIAGRTVDDHLIDLSQEATFEDSIVALPEPVRVSRDVLLTGATGFVGRFLLWQLLNETDAMVHCLVKASSQQQAMDRLRATLVTWDLWQDRFERRVSAIAGDLELPRLGLDEINYQTLARRIDTIYHCATSMNHLETYTAAKAANVESARELLRLATTHKAKCINYVSTLSIFRSLATETIRIVNERTPIEDERHTISHGYAGSKWVAEKIFMTASGHGIACNIFRLGLVWADTERGRYDELQREYRVIKSCLLSGIGIENYCYPMPPTPVDCVAQAIVSLANRHREGGGIFHLSSPTQRIDGVFERCNDFAGMSLNLVPHYEWIGQMRRLHGQGWSLPIVPLIEYAFSMSEQAFVEHQRNLHASRTRVDSSCTQAELKQLGVEVPIADDALLVTCLESMCQRDADLRMSARSSRMRRKLSPSTTPWTERLVKRDRDPGLRTER